MVSDDAGGCSVPSSVCSQFGTDGDDLLVGTPLDAGRTLVARQRRVQARPQVLAAGTTVARRVLLVRSGA